MKKEKKNYNIGLDIGSTTVGWSVTDENKRLIKKGNRNLWGTNLFGEAETAASRRQHRGMRRRYNRRRYRIALLQELTADMFEKNDPYFFKRLQCSYMDDIDRESENNIFLNRKGNKTLPLFGGLENDEIKSFYKGYSKTIYHLRKYVMEADHAVDPRLVYLCMHHIVKYRGNFLYEGQQFSLNNAQQILEDLNQVFQLMNDFAECDVFTAISSEKLLQILINSSMRKADKKDAADELFTECDYIKNYKELIKALLGYQFNFSILINKTKEKCDLNFSDSDSDEKEEDILSNYPDCDELLMLIKNIYSYITLAQIMSGNAGGYVSDAMIAIFEKHKKDLKILKTLITNNNDRESYRELFKTRGAGSYENYVHKAKDTGQDVIGNKIKKIIENYPDCKEKKYILDEIENMNFLPKCNLSTNAAIPYQLNEIELKKILENQGKYYPCLKENADKIISILTFRIPYYYGPLVTNNYNPHAWIIRKTDEKLYPWNHEQIVDQDKTAELFIRRMTNHCTYLLGEDTIAKNSLLYSRFEVLNELNGIRINGEKLTSDLKKDLLENLFEKKAKVKVEDVRRFAVNHQYISENETCEIKGTQKEDEFASSLSSWIKFKSIYGDDFEKEYSQIEQIIEWISIYNDKKIIARRIKKDYPQLGDDRLNSILKLNYKGFGRLSRKLLTGLKDDNSVGSKATVMDVLENTTDNFMQIISSGKYGYKKMIENENNNNVFDSCDDEDIVKEMYCSPTVKRGILQSLKLVKELRDYFGCDPQNIFVEMAREEGEKKRTNSRERTLKNIYDGLIKENIMLVGNEKISRTSDAYKSIEEKKLQDERMYLYVLQNGKCMYTMQTLDINRLSEYQIDHILPQSYIKDDSIENKVLVIPSENQRKKDSLLLDEGIIDKCRVFWKKLYDSKLIGEKKYRNLTRRKISDGEEIGFINRQLVETRQICKNVANILKNRYLSTGIISVKATLSSEFRHKYELYKLRSVNDVHHAHDAYLAAIIGDYILKKYPFMLTDIGFDSYTKGNSEIKQKLFEEIEERNKLLKGNKNYNFNSFIVEQLNETVKTNKDTGEIIWAGEQQIDYIKKIFGYKDYFITYKHEYGQSKLYKETVYSPKEKKEGFPVKSDRPFERYGGYIEGQTAYGMAIEYKSSKKEVRKVVTIPQILYNASLADKINFVAKTEKTDASSIQVVKEIVQLQQMFITFNTPLIMASPSEWNNARQLFIDKKYHKTIYQIEKNQVNEIDEQMLNEVFENILQTVIRTAPLYAEQCKSVLNKKDDFVVLDKENKIKAIKAILQSCSAGPASPDLKFGDLKVRSRFGRMSAKTINLDDTIFVNQSVSGIYTNTFKL